MLLASYKAIHPNYLGLGNIGIRMRLHSVYSHNEVIIEQSDNLDHLLPDKTSAKYDNGSQWAMSSSGFDKIPDYSPRRVGKTGGVRLKRIYFDPDKWDITPIKCDPIKAFNVFKEFEGAPYDWSLNLGFLNWPFMILSFNNGKKNCSEMCAQIMGLQEPERFDPASLTMVARYATNLQ